jgi:hypothetical protein
MVWGMCNFPNSMKINQKVSKETRDTWCLSFHLGKKSFPRSSNIWSRISSFVTRRHLQRTAAYNQYLNIQAFNVQYERLNPHKITINMHANTHKEHGKYQSSFEPYGVEYNDLFSTQLLTIFWDSGDNCALSDVRRQCSTINGDLLVVPFTFIAFATEETCKTELNISSICKQWSQFCLNKLTINVSYPSVTVISYGNLTSLSISKGTNFLSLIVACKGPWFMNPVINYTREHIVHFS